MHRRRPLAAFAAAIVVSSSASVASAQSILPAVFVTNNVGDSVTSFTINPNGTLNRIAAFPSGDGPQTVSLSPDGRFLSVANGTASTTVEELRIFQVNPDASLTLRLTTTVPDSPLDVQWTSNAHLAVTQTGVANVRMFEYNAAANTFTRSAGLRPLPGHEQPGDVARMVEALGKCLAHGSNGHRHFDPLFLKPGMKGNQQGC